MIAIDAELCDGCRVCTKICPHAVLSMHQRKAVLTAEEACIECGACQLNCEQDAIVVTKGTGCMVAIIRDDILGLGQPATAGASCCG